MMMNPLKKVDQRTTGLYSYHWNTFYIKLIKLTNKHSRVHSSLLILARITIKASGNLNIKALRVDCELKIGRKWFSNSPSSESFVVWMCRFVCAFPSEQWPRNGEFPHCASRSFIVIIVYIFHIMYVLAARVRVITAIFELSFNEHTIYDGIWCMYI